MTQIQPPPAGPPYPGEPTPAGPYGPTGPQAGYPYQPQPPRKTSVLAVLSLIFAFLVAPVGLILGIVAVGQIRKRGESGTGLAVAGIVIGAIGTLIVAAVVLIAVFATPTLNTDDLEGKISATTQQTVGAAPSAVNCPDSIEMKAGTTFTCTATLDGDNLPFVVTQKDDQGNVDYKSQGWTVTARAVDYLNSEATNNFPDTQWTTTCANGKKVVVGGPGTTYTCTLSVVDDPAKSEQHTVRVTSDAGDVTVE